MADYNAGTLPITAAIITNDFLIRLGVQTIFDLDTAIKLVGHFSDGSKLEKMLIDRPPQVVIIDVNTQRDVTELIRQVKQQLPETKVVILTGLDDRERTRDVFNCGVDGIVLKIQPPQVLVAAIQAICIPEIDTVKMGGTGTSALPSREQIGGIEGTNPNFPQWDGALTEREREIIVLVSQGLSNKDIADRLCISTITVRHHLTSIFDKLGVSNRQKLLIRAHQCGLVALTASA
jgi:DNA-binding NarL/FixJ family response regulator